MSDSGRQKDDVKKIGKNDTCLLNNLRYCNTILAKKGHNKIKTPKTIQLLQKHLKLTKAAITAVENSIFLHSDSFEINTNKSQDNE